MKKYYLGIDQGTTGTTALLLDENWHVAARGYKEQVQHYPHSGWVEQDPMEIWQNIGDTVSQVLTETGISPSEISCLGLDNQGETVMLWERETGIPVYPAIVWQDRRTARAADELAGTYGSMILRKTGLLVDAYFGATKIQWMIQHVEGVSEKIAQGRILAGTMDTWVIWKLTHGRLHMTDLSTASRTMLLNMETGDWDEEILSILGIPRSILPEIRSSAEFYGVTDPGAFFGVRIPISGSVTDQQAALFGQNCLEPGSVKTTYGTGCFMLMNTGRQKVVSDHGLLTTVAWCLNNEEKKKEITYALDGGIYIAGAAIQWLRDQLKIIEKSSDTEAMAKSVEDTGGVFFVPAFVGLAAPHWDPYARGTMIGITGGTTRAHIVRATLESIAYQVKDNLDVMVKDSGIPIEVMRVDGGMVENEFLMQFQADILGIPVDVSAITEMSALGAAYLAAYGIGEIRSLKDLEGKWECRKRYEPRMSEAYRDKLLHKWHRAVERAKAWEEE